MHTQALTPARRYRNCATYSCGPDLVEHVQFQGMDTAYLSAECQGAFNVSIVQLEYLNEDNIAIIVQHSAYGEYDAETGVGNGTNSGYTTYWLNPATMRVGTTIWNTSVPASNYATLCPSMQILPRVGTFASELVNSGVFVIRFVFNSILYTPGMAPIWKADGACPSPGASHRHSILINCGQDLFSLDDFFDSLDDAGAVFWHSLGTLAQLTNPAGTTTGPVNPIADLLNGMEQYGHGTIDLWSARSTVIRLASIPVKDQIDQGFGMLTNSPGSTWATMGGALKVNAAGIAWARFTYKVVSEVALVIAKGVLRGESTTTQVIWQTMWATLYDLEESYTSIITDRSLMACAGIKLMFGLTNPWANMLYSMCAINAEYYSSVLHIGMDIFVQIPMVKCVCKDASGQDARSYVENTCAQNVPLTLRPQMFMMVNSLQVSSCFICLMTRTLTLAHSFNTATGGDLVEIQEHGVRPGRAESQDQSEE